jgi:hypothetical protein
MDRIAAHIGSWQSKKMTNHEVSNNDSQAVHGAGGDLRTGAEPPIETKLPAIISGNETAAVYPGGSSDSPSGSFAAGSGATQSAPEIICSGEGLERSTKGVQQANLTTVSEWQIEEANRRQEVLKTFYRLIGKIFPGDIEIRQPIQNPLSRTNAAKKVGIAYTTLWRYELDFFKEGYEGLIPGVSTGRKTVLQNLGFTPEEIKLLMAECQGLSLDTKSTTTALRLFAHSDRCPEKLANVILDPNRCSKHAIPPSIRRAATPSKNSHLAHRGPRALDLGGIYIPRRVDILPGDIFCPDDTTPIFAWWVPWIQNEEYPFGVKLLQGQLLRIIDVASQCPVGKVLIAREKSSYRASDIWSWVGFMAEDIGLPRLGFQMERGSWDAGILQGIEVEHKEGDLTHSRRVGGLRQLPANITDWHKTNHPNFPFQNTLQTWTSYLPKSKTIEAYIDRVETLEGMLWGSLGRDQMRKPYEKMKKLFQQCSRPGSKIDCRNYFLSGQEMMAKLTSYDDFLASEPMEGEVFKGVPRLLFQNSIAERPLFFLPAESAWLFKSDWKQVRITSGWARVRLTHPVTGQRYSHFYDNPRMFAEMEGRDVLVYYDRHNFEQPAQIVAASRFAVGSRQFYPGDFVCEADYFEKPGMFLDSDTSGHELRKQWRSAVMTIYGRASVHAPSRKMPVEIQARRAELPASQAEGQTFTLGQPTPFSKGATHTVDGRPAPAKPKRSFLASPTADEFAKKRERLAASASAARSLTAATENFIHTKP